jgi:hypothetical protein
MMLEAQEIAEKLGVKFPIDVERRIDGGAAVGAHRTSMLQDLDAGRPMEIDALVGSVQELGGSPRRRRRPSTRCSRWSRSGPAPPAFTTAEPDEPGLIGTSLTDHSEEMVCAYPRSGECADVLQGVEADRWSSPICRPLSRGEKMALTCRSGPAAALAIPRQSLRMGERFIVRDLDLPFRPRRGR